MAKKKDTTELVAMEKNGQKLRVHPSTVAAHQRAGWVLLPAQPEPDAEEPARGSEGDEKSETDSSEE